MRIVMDTGWTRWLVGILIASSMVLGVAVVAAATERSDDEVSRITRQVSQELYSPYCPGQTLAMCPSANASYARQDIQKMARQGKDAEEIKAELIERYGEGFEMIEPSTRDHMTLLGGIIGGLAVAVGVVGFLARRRLSGDETDEDDQDRDDGDRDEQDLDDAYLAELRSEYRD